LISDPEVDVAQALQAYFYRWEIEVDQKEEKDLLGVGQAQVWSQEAVPRPRRLCPFGGETNLRDVSAPLS
jgi:hypothetical protein